MFEVNEKIIKNTNELLEELGISLVLRDDIEGEYRLHCEAEQKKASLIDFFNYFGIDLVKLGYDGAFQKIVNNNEITYIINKDNNLSYINHSVGRELFLEFESLISKKEKNVDIYILKKVTREIIEDYNANQKKNFLKQIIKENLIDIMLFCLFTFLIVYTLPFFLSYFATSFDIMFIEKSNDLFRNITISYLVFLPLLLAAFYLKGRWLKKVINRKIKGKNSIELLEKIIRNIYFIIGNTIVILFLVSMISRINVYLLYTTLISLAMYILVEFLFLKSGENKKMKINSIYISSSIYIITMFYFFFISVHLFNKELLSFGKMLYVNIVFILMVFFISKVLRKLKVLGESIQFYNVSKNIFKCNVLENQMFENQKMFFSTKLCIENVSYWRNENIVLLNMNNEFESNQVYQFICDDNEKATTFVDLILNKNLPFNGRITLNNLNIFHYDNSQISYLIKESGIYPPIGLMDKKWEINENTQKKLLDFELNEIIEKVNKNEVLYLYEERVLDIFMKILDEPEILILSNYSKLFTKKQIDVLMDICLEYPGIIILLDDKRNERIDVDNIYEI